MLLKYTNVGLTCSSSDLIGLGAGLGIAIFLSSQRFSCVVSTENLFPWITDIFRKNTAIAYHYIINEGRHDRLHSNTLNSYVS